MSAGASALNLEGRLRRATSRWQLKARERAALAEKAAAGERQLAELTELLRPLGWRLLHDRALPGGGKIDSLAVGPSGVAVLEAREWTGEVTVQGGRLLQEGRPRPGVLEAMTRQRRAVAAALAEAALEAPVRGLVALTAAAHRQLPLVPLGPCQVGGVEAVVSFLAGRSEGQLAGQRLGILERYLAERFPAVGEGAAPAVAASLARIEQERSLFGVGENAFMRLWYLRSCQRGGRRCLFLKMGNGEDLGWKDGRTGAVRLTCEGLDAPLVQAVLDWATPVGARCPAGELSGLPAELLGSRLVGRSSRVYVSLLLGQEWKKGATHRLYGRLIDRAEGHFDLGYVDLQRGELRPSLDGKLTKRLRAAGDYLQVLADGYPARSSAEG